MKLTGNVFLKIKKYAGLFLHITLIGSILYSIVQIILTSHGESASSHVQSDYVLMLVQCILGLVVMVLPSFLEKKLSFVIPNSMYVLYFVFLYCAIYLGEVRRFYYIIPFWDTILHAFSGGMLGAFGFLLVSVLNDAKTVRFELSPFFVALFAFCFALSIGAFWEIYEYTGDLVLGLNMQKYRLSDGTNLVGQLALSDTMIDLMIDTLSAAVVATYGFFVIRDKKDILPLHFDNDSNRIGEKDHLTEDNHAAV